MTSKPVQTKSVRTRARILAAARKGFAEAGLNNTSIRDIAATAGVDPALVMRYFGSKELLFAAAADFDLHLPDLAQVAPGDIGHVLARHFIQVWEHSPAGTGLEILLRSATTEPAARDRLREIFAGQVLPALRAIDPSGASDWRAGLVSSHVLGLALCRYVLRLPMVADLPEEVVIDEAGKVLQSLLQPAMRK